MAERQTDIPGLVDHIRDASEGKSRSRSAAASTVEFDSADAGSSPAATAIPDDYWSRVDLLVDPPLRSGTSAIDIELLRDMLCDLVASAPSDGHVVQFAKDNRPHLNRLLNFRDAAGSIGTAVVQAAIEARRKAFMS